MDSKRLDYTKISPELYRSLLHLERFVHSSGLDSRILNLITLRASQINGCGWCIDMHTKDAIAEGEEPQRLFLVSSWKEAPQYSKREKIALEWCEAVTKISDQDVSDDLYGRAVSEFKENGLVALTAAVVAINSWNRLNVAFKAVPGTYRRKEKSPDQEQL